MAATPTEPDAQSRPLAEVRDVEAGYRGRAGRVLHGVTLRVSRGELVALIGTNASGKTTLLRVLAGTVAPSRGDVVLDGTPIARLRRAEVARRVAVLPQTAELPDGFTVAQLVEMGRTPHATGLFGSSDHDRAVVARAMADANVLPLAVRPADTLSGGERQRLLIAMALAQEPRLLLLDEPTLHLDVAHQVSLLEVVRTLCRARGIGAVAVLHDLNLAAAYADRVVVLHGGRIAGDGPPPEVLVAELVRRVFGVEVDEVRTARGDRYLVVGPRRDAPVSPAASPRCGRRGGGRPSRPSRSAPRSRPARPVVPPPPF